MSSELTRFHLDYVDAHINQTALVNELLVKEVLSYEDIEGCGEDTEIYQWVAFEKFRRYDYEKLDEAKIPVLDSDYGAWVGITSFGSHYDLYVYPELIAAIFGIECTHEDIDRVRWA